MTKKHDTTQARWARFRFSVVGGLLSAPPVRGQLRGELEALAGRLWRHPIKGVPVRLGVSTIERWYYAARKAGGDPLGALRQRVRRDAGTHPRMGEALRQAALAQWRAHRGWSIKLHLDNLRAQARREASLMPVPSYSTFLRFMRASGLRRARGRRAPRTAGGEAAARRFELREVRSYESTHVGGLFHADFHEAGRKVLMPDGRLMRPKLFGCMDDRSRVACHLQWYASESTQTFVHGLMQAFLKRGLPRSLMTDQGSAERAAEVIAGLERLGISRDPTLPYSPYQNAKQESFWCMVEGRLLAMLEGVEDLTLEALNEATQAWVEMDYNREVHSELGMEPLARLLEGPSVLREAPAPEVLREGFRRTVKRRQRTSDGTFTLEGTRFEVPSCYGHLREVVVRYAAFDLGHVHLVDPRTGEALVRLFPLDKEKNASGRRRERQGAAHAERGTPIEQPAPGIAPLLEDFIQAYREQRGAAGYLPLEETR